MSAYNARVAHDALGVLFHGAAVVWLSMAPSDDTWKLILAQEVVAFIAHIVYCANHWHNLLDGKRNFYKWIEYAISATLGTFAVLTASDGHVDWWWVVLLACTCATQQMIGYMLEYTDAFLWLNFFVAWAFQVCEFLVVLFVPVASHVTFEEIWSLRVVYVIAWVPFGLLAGYDLKTRHVVSCIRNLDGYINSIEAMYACLSWTSKLSVVLLSVQGSWVMTGVTLCVGGLVFGGTVVWLRPNLGPY